MVYLGVRGEEEDYKAGFAIPKEAYVPLVCLGDNLFAPVHFLLSGRGLLFFLSYSSWMY